jgi:tetratricopeptide (TPR) repeat protein
MKANSHPSRLVPVICGVTLIVALAGAITTVRLIEHQRNTAKSDEVLFISSPKLLKRMSLGYHGLLADLYWTRAVQYFGRKHNADELEYRLLGPILRITSELDPQLTVTYEYGSIFLAQRAPNGAGDPQAAVELVKYGIEHNPDAWRLYYALGYINGIELKDYQAAAKAFEEGAKIPGAYFWMRVMAANFATHGGEVGTARYLWSAIFGSTEDKMVRENAYKHLRALEAKQDIEQLQQMVDEFHSSRGSNPATLADLVETGQLLRVPRDPTGRPYKLTGNGRVTVQNSKDLPYLEPDGNTFDPIAAMVRRAQSH